ncbi:MAG TPA: TOMM precursor leader peptide-binding protein [Gaiellaceae bacterium]|nr:TOMM precursor leader peptide-binding protein [Gaiellaceae bacterium]
MSSPLQRSVVEGAVPGRPLLAPWYRLIEDGERLLLEYGQAVVVLEGAAVRTLLPALLPLLDGTRTLDDLVARLGTAVGPAIEAALATLQRHGLLVDGPEAPSRNRDTADALAAAYSLAPAVVAARLDAAVIGVVGGSSTGVEVARLLRAAGVGETRRVSWEEPAIGDLTVVAPAAGEIRRLDPWNRTALAEGCAWFPVRPYDGRLAAVGPLIVPGESCCYECLGLRRAANLEYGPDLPLIETAPIVATADPAFESLVVALTAHLVLRFVAARDTTLPGTLYAVEQQPAPTIAEHAVLRVPRCSVCSPAERRAAPLPWHAAEAA